VLKRGIAEEGRYPAVDVLASLSRLAPRVWTADQVRAVGELKRLVSRFEDSRDLRAMGGHVAGADGELDRAIEVVPRLYRALTQNPGDAPCVDAFRETAAALS
jgi:flagellum-specific ATP synthase